MSESNEYITKIEYNCLQKITDRLYSGSCGSDCPSPATKALRLLDGYEKEVIRLNEQIESSIKYASDLKQTLAIRDIEIKRLKKVLRQEVDDNDSKDNLINMLERKASHGLQS